MVWLVGLLVGCGELDPYKECIKGIEIACECGDTTWDGTATGACISESKMHDICQDDAWEYEDAMESRNDTYIEYSQTLLEARACANDIAKRTCEIEDAWEECYDE